MAYPKFEVHYKTRSEAILEWIHASTFDNAMGAHCYLNDLFQTVGDVDVVEIRCVIWGKDRAPDLIKKRITRYQWKQHKRKEKKNA